MVKSLIAIGVSVALLLGLSVFEWSFVRREFSDFGEEVRSLYDKAEAETATIGDARVVQEVWEDRKSRLHVWIPHNDVNKIDEYMAEAVRFIGEKNYALALPKLEVLLHLSTCLPDTYSPALENVL